MGWPASLKSSNSKNCLVLFLSPEVSWDSELSFPSVVEGWSYKMLKFSLTICHCGVQPSSNQTVHETPRYTSQKYFPNFFASQIVADPLLCWEEGKNVLWALCTWRKYLLQEQEQLKVLWKIATNTKLVLCRLPAPGSYLVNLNALIFILKHCKRIQGNGCCARWNSNP